MIVVCLFTDSVESCYNYGMASVIKYGKEPTPAKRIRRRQGDMIRSARKLKGLSALDLAEAVGVHVSAISQWETGRYSPRAHHQLAIARALEVPHSLLFSLDAEAAA